MCVLSAVAEAVGGEECLPGYLRVRVSVSVRVRPWPLAPDFVWSLGA